MEAWKGSVKDVPAGVILDDVQLHPAHQGTSAPRFPDDLELAYLAIIDTSVLPLFLTSGAALRVYTSNSGTKASLSKLLRRPYRGILLSVISGTQDDSHPTQLLVFSPTPSTPPLSTSSSMPKCNLPTPGPQPQPTTTQPVYALPLKPTRHFPSPSTSPPSHPTFLPTSSPAALRRVDTDPTLSAKKRSATTSLLDNFDGRKKRKKPTVTPKTALKMMVDGERKDEKDSEAKKTIVGKVVGRILARRRSGTAGLGSRSATPALNGAGSATGVTTGLKELRDLLVGNLEFTFRSTPLPALDEEKVARAAEYFLAGLDGHFESPPSSTTTARPVRSRQASIDPSSRSLDGPPIPIKSESLFAKARRGLHKRSSSLTGSMLGGLGRRPSMSVDIKKENEEEEDGLELPALPAPTPAKEKV